MRGTEAGSPCVEHVKNFLPRKLPSQQKVAFFFSSVTGVISLHIKRGAMHIFIHSSSVVTIEFTVFIYVVPQNVTLVMLIS